MRARKREEKWRDTLVMMGRAFSLLFGIMVSVAFATTGCKTEDPQGSTLSAKANVPGDSPGAEAVRNRKCGDCHTTDPAKVLSGSKTKLPNYPDTVELYPPNLTPDNDTGIGTWTDYQLQIAIRNGVDKDGLTLCPQMKHYADMQDDELNAIIAYLRSLPAVKNTIPKSICPPIKTKDD